MSGFENPVSLPENIEIEEEKNEPDFGVFESEGEIDSEQINVEDFIKNEINSRDNISLENSRQAELEIIEKMKDSGIYSSESEEIVGLYMATLETALDDKMRGEIGKDERGREQLFEMDKRNAAWIDDICDYILENRNNPDKIEEFWQEYDHIYENISLAGKYRAESRKYGILSQIASLELSKQLEEYLKEVYIDVNIEVVASTAEEDTVDKVDFWIYMNGDEKSRIACQVKCLDLGKDGYDIRHKFVSENIINFSKPNNDNLVYDYPQSKKIEEFFRKHGNKGMFFIIPRDKKGPMVDDSGRPSENLKIMFETKARKDIDILASNIINNGLYSNGKK